MQYYLHKQIFYINSRNRTSGTDSDFWYSLDINPIYEYDRITVLDCSIPKSYYLVQSPRNTFIVKEGINTFIISMPPGNYNRTSFKNILETQLNSTCDFTYSISYENIAVTQDTGKYTFTVSNNTSQPSFIFESYLYEQFGFDENSTNTFSGNSLTSTNVINMNLEGTLFLRSNICQNRGENILQNLATTSQNSFAYINFINYNPSEFSKEYTRGNNNTYQFILTNEDGQIIDLNGQNIVFTLMLYKQNNIDLIIKDYIKYKTLP